MRSTSVSIAGVRIDPVSSEGLLDSIARFLRNGRSNVVHFCPSDPLARAITDADYRDVLQAGSLNVPDGMSVVWALRLLGHRASRLTGTDALHLASAWGVERALRHYFVGGTPEVLSTLVANLERAQPGLRVCGAESPPFGAIDELGVEGTAERIRAARADLVWVGLGAPKQELYAERLRALDCAPVILCIGAAFDFASGAKRRAPAWMQRAGLEWLHRLIAEPRRLWRRYLVGGPRFAVHVLADCVHRRLSR